MNYRLVLLTWGGVLALLGISVLAVQLSAGVLQYVISLSCAVLMAGLLMTFFMHLRTAQTVIRLYALGGLLWLSFLWLLSLADYLSR